MDTASGHVECVTTGRSLYVICVRRDANGRKKFFIPQELAANSLSNIQNVQNKMDWYFGKQWTYFCLTYLTFDTWHLLLPQCDQGSLKYYQYTLPVWGYTTLLVIQQTLSLGSSRSRCPPFMALHRKLYWRCFTTVGKGDIPSSIRHKSLAVLLRTPNPVQCWLLINTLRPRQDGRRFPDDTFKRIFLNENVIILIKISLKFVPYGPINNIPALIQISHYLNQWEVWNSQNMWWKSWRELWMGWSGRW